MKKKVFNEKELIMLAELMFPEAFEA